MTTRLFFQTTGCIIQCMIHTVQTADWLHQITIRVLTSCSVYPFLEYIWWIFFKKWIWYKISSALKNAFWSIRHQVLQSQKVFGNMQNIFSRNRQYMKWWKSISQFKNLQSQEYEHSSWYYICVLPISD